MTSSPRFISLEGLDGAGKTTHLNFVRQWLESKNIPFVMTREPGGTPLGEDLRAMLLHREMHADTELLLMFAARREHVAKVIQPALAAGQWVVSDRFSDASFAYQGGGRGLDMARIRALEQLTLGDFRPDLTLFLDVPIHVSQERLAQTRDMDRFECEAADFHDRVRRAYLERIAADPQRFCVLNADRPIDVIQTDIAQALAAL